MTTLQQIDSQQYIPYIHGTFKLAAGRLPASGTVTLADVEALEIPGNPTQTALVRASLRRILVNGRAAHNCRFGD
jgi:hypothetical protein